MAAAPTAANGNPQVNNLANFHQHSRLHFIGSWVNEATGFLRVYLEQHPQHDHSALFRQQRIVCHVDMDCFFVLVALSKPENAHLRGKPVAVASGAGANSEVSSCSYEARTFGVRAGMWMSQAKRLCPQLAVVPYDFERVRQINERIYRAAFELCPSSVSRFGNDHDDDDGNSSNDDDDRNAKNKNNDDDDADEIFGFGEGAAAASNKKAAAAVDASAAAAKKIRKDKAGKVTLDSCEPLHMKLQVISVDEFFVAFDTDDFDFAERYCEALRKRIVEDSNGCTASCGIAPNVHVARAVTALAKPNGIKVVRGTPFCGGGNTSNKKNTKSSEVVDQNNKELLEFVRRMNVDDIHGVGRSAMAKCVEMMKELKMQQLARQFQAAKLNNNNKTAVVEEDDRDDEPFSAAGALLRMGHERNNNATKNNVAVRREREDEQDADINNKKKQQERSDGDASDADLEEEQQLSGEEREAKREREQKQREKQAAANAASETTAAAAAAAAGDSDRIKIGDLLPISLDKLKKYLGAAMADKLHRLAHHGEDNTLVVATGSADGGAIPKAVGTTMNYAVRLSTVHELSSLVLQMAKDVSSKLERCGAGAMIAKLSVLVRLPDAPLTTKKHMGCGRCYERVLGSVKAPTADSAYHTPEKFHDLFMPLALKAVTVEPLSSLSQQESAAAAAAAPASSSPIHITDIRGMTIHASSIVALKKKKKGTGSGSKADLQQISLTASFRNVFNKQQQQQQQLKGLGASSSSSATTVFEQIDDDDDNGGACDGDGDDNDDVVFEESRVAAGNKSNNDKKKPPLAPIFSVPNSHQAKKMKEQKAKEAAKELAARDLVFDDDGAVVICSGNLLVDQDGQPREKKMEPRHPPPLFSIPKKKTPTDSAAAAAADVLCLDDDDGVSARAPNRKVKAEKLKIDNAQRRNDDANDDDDDVIQIMSASPVKQQKKPAAPAAAAAPPLLVDDEDDDRAVALARGSKPNVKPMNSVTTAGTAAATMRTREEKYLHDAAAEDDDLFDPEVNPFADIARVNAAIRKGTILQLLRPAPRQHGTTQQLRKLAASIVLCENAAPVAMPLLFPQPSSLSSKVSVTATKSNFSSEVIEAARAIV